MMNRYPNNLLNRYCGTTRAQLRELHNQVDFKLACFESFVVTKKQALRIEGGSAMNLAVNWGVNHSEALSATGK